MGALRNRATCAMWPPVQYGRLPNTGGRAQWHAHASVHTCIRGCVCLHARCQKKNSKRRWWTTDSRCLRMRRRWNIPSNIPLNTPSNVSTNIPSNVPLHAPTPVHAGDRGVLRVLVPHLWSGGKGGEARPRNSAPQGGGTCAHTDAYVARAAQPQARVWTRACACERARVVYPRRAP